MPPQALSVQTLDPPEHAAIRHLLVEAVRAQDNDRTSRMVYDAATELAQQLLQRPSFDVVTDFAEPLALRTITGFLGVPEPDIDWFVPIATTIVDGMDAGVWPERGEPAMRARLELSAWTDTWLDHPPRSGMVAFLAAGLPDSGVDRGVLVNSLRVLLHAGYTSASKLLSLGVAALLERPAGLTAMLGASSGPAVDELARFTSPVQAMSRACVEDTELGGVTIRAGQGVILLLAAANRDPARFDRPDLLDLRRQPNPHLGFGRGAHSCLGSPLATLQARIALTALARSAPNLRAIGSPSYRRTMTLRTLDKLEVAPR